VYCVWQVVKIPTIISNNPILFGGSNHQEIWDGRFTWHVKGRGEVHAGIWFGELKEREYLEDLNLYGPVPVAAQSKHCMLRLWVRIPPGAWMFVCCECRVLSGRGFCDELITRPEESYRLCCVVVCDLETLRMRRLWPALGCSATGEFKDLFEQFQNVVLKNLYFLRKHNCLVCPTAQQLFLRSGNWHYSYQIANLQAFLCNNNSKMAANSANQQLADCRFNFVQGN